MSAYDVLPLWDGVSPLPEPVPTSPFTVDRAGRWRVRGRFARREYVTAWEDFPGILRGYYRSVRDDVLPVITPLMATLSKLSGGTGRRWAGSVGYFSVGAT